jgi:hypothetical protein
MANHMNMMNMMEKMHGQRGDDPQAAAREPPIAVPAPFMAYPEERDRSAT